MNILDEITTALQSILTLLSDYFGWLLQTFSEALGLFGI